MRAKEETQERPATAGVPVAVSAWLVPGLGHLMLGRTRRAITFFVIVTGMFALGSTSGESSSPSIPRSP